MHMQQGRTGRNLLSLPTWYEGLAIPIFHKQVEVEYNNRKSTELTSLITVQQMEYTVDELAIKKNKLEITKEKREYVQNFHGAS